MEEIEVTPQPLNPEEPTGLLLLQDAQYYLYESGKWARFLGIMGFIGAGFLSLLAIFYNPRPFNGVVTGIFGFLIYECISAIIFFYSLNLYKFGTGIKKGIELKNPGLVSIALGKLNTFFKIKGIILIVVLALYVVIIVIVIAAAIIGSSILHRSSGGNFIS